MSTQIDIREVHWLLDIVQHIDVGVVVLDKQHRVEAWNAFMENHSGISPDHARQRSLFELFPEIDRPWFERKLNAVAELGTQAFSLWQQRPYLMRFKSYQPITGKSEFMYQNVTISPLAGQPLEHLCLVIYDMTDAAVAAKAQSTLTP